MASVRSLSIVLNAQMLSGAIAGITATASATLQDDIDPTFTKPVSVDVTNQIADGKTLAQFQDDVLEILEA
jgi:hypothetical protein